jgi:hypothetical protein
MLDIEIMIDGVHSELLIIAVARRTGVSGTIVRTGIPLLSAAVIGMTAGRIIALLLHRQ